MGKRNRPCCRFEWAIAEAKCQRWATLYASYMLNNARMCSVGMAPSANFKMICSFGGNDRRAQEILRAPLKGTTQGWSCARVVVPSKHKLLSSLGAPTITPISRPDSQEHSPRDTEALTGERHDWYVTRTVISLDKTETWARFYPKNKIR